MTLDRDQIKPDAEQLIHVLADAIAELLGDSLPSPQTSHLLDKAATDHGWVHPHDRNNAATEDRDQIRRDADLDVTKLTFDELPDLVGRLADYCFALLTELEQAEQKAEEETRIAAAMHRKYENAHAAHLLGIKTRGELEDHLAKTPALVEALKEAIALADDWAEDWSYGGVKDATERTERIREALAAWETD